MAAISVVTRVIAPTVSGMFSDPGGATVAKSAGSIAVIVVPTFWEMAIAEQRSKNVPAELLEEVFELNMALEEMRGGDDSARPQLEGASRHFRGMLADIDGELEHQFLAFDQSGEAERDAVLQRLRATLDRRRYIENLVREVEKELAPAA